MPFPFLAPLIGAAIGGATTLLTNRSNRRAQQAVNAQNKVMSEASNKQAEAMWRESREWELEDEREQYARMVMGAREAGLNPLSVIGTHAGPSALGTPGLTTPTFQASMNQEPNIGGYVQDGLQGLADWRTSKTAADEAEKTLQDDLTKVQIDKHRAALSSGVIEHRPGADFIGARPEDVTFHAPGIAPRPRPTMASAGDTPIFKPDGKAGTIPRRMADRLGINAWDYVLAEDYEAALGDVAGQIVVGPRIPGATSQIEQDADRAWTDAGTRFFTPGIAAGSKGRRARRQ